jgi:hypothetical protein
VSSFERGLAAVGRRTETLDAEAAEGDTMILVADPEQTVRRVLLGFVGADEDVEQAALLTAQIAAQLRAMNWEDEEASTAALRVTAAQLLAIGAATEMARDGRLA